MKIAIYTRQSKYTDINESVENQIKLCKDYCDNLFDDVEYTIYTDEAGVSEFNNRMALLQLLIDMKFKMIDAIVVARINRISSNIEEFSHLMSETLSNNIPLLSVKEEFNSLTYTGTAKHTIGLLEKIESEAKSEKVKENMYNLAEKGFWLGGVTPLGYKSVQYENDIASNAKGRPYMKLEIVEKDAELTKLIFDLYLELNSLAKVSAELKKLGHKSRRGLDWDDTSINKVLRNVTYVKSSEEIFKYFKDKGIEILGTPDNTHGILTFGKNTGNEIYTVSDHLGFIESDKWLEAQRKLQKQKCGPKDEGKEIGLLRDLFYCKSCGAKMSVYFKKQKGNNTNIYYVCSTKRRKGLKYCSNTNLRLDDFDNFILNSSNIIDENILNAASNINIEKEETKSNIDYLKHREDFNKLTTKEQRLHLSKHISKVFWNGNSNEAIVTYNDDREEETILKF